MYINRFSKRGIPFEISKKYQGKDEQFHCGLSLLSSAYCLPPLLAFAACRHGARKQWGLLDSSPLFYIAIQTHSFIMTDSNTLLKTTLIIP
ncbi:MAG: hypothetical protein V3U58_06005, partial [Thermodesulfobacteriota bacterium]